MTKNQALVAGTPFQVLTGSYTVKRVSVTGTAGGTVSFYDAVASKTQNQPAVGTFQTTKTGFTRSNPPASPPGQTQIDCGGIARVYDYTGIGYDTPVTIAANAAKPLPAATAYPNGTNALDTNVVLTRGLLAEAVGQAATLTIEYYPNLSSA